MKRAVGLGLVALSVWACSPAEIVTDVTRRTARTVVLPVVSAVAPAPADQLATDCIMANALPEELDALVRDVGTRAGTLTIQNVRTIATRPATQACIAGKGLAPLML